MTTPWSAAAPAMWEDPQDDATPPVWARRPGLRVDSHVETGTLVTPYYDSMLAKLIAHGSTRDAALVRQRNALAATVLEGVSTNLELHRTLLASPAFSAGGVDTGWLARFLDASGAAVAEMAGRAE